ncbi:MAG: shikimate kinase, partial [Desulfobulbales bacterium]
MLGKEAGSRISLSWRSQPIDRIILTGFRATGKSTVGKRLAELIGYRFIDTDRELAVEMKCSLREFVAHHGWAAFRQL